MKKKLNKKNDSLLLDKDYTNFLGDIKNRLKAAQIRAALAANSELIKFYWELGIDLIEKQKAFKWGERFLEQFSHDMRQEFPEMRGFSKRNLEYMRRFAMLYPTAIAKQPVSQLPWGHIVRLMQIESGLYERQGLSAKKITNYQQHLPVMQSDLANEILKDPYNFDFLTIQGDAHERAIENALVAHMRDFLLELGQGFAFVGSQVPLTFEDEEFFVDLLFYHLNLRCFVVIELKATKFKPEHTGQLGFYLAAVDDLLRKEGDNQTIGILLCKSKSKIIAEYALRSMKVPIGVSEYILSKALPKELKINLPTVEEIEAKLNDTRA